MSAYYLKIALRNLYKNKLYTALNIFCLSIGMVCIILATLYLRHEYRYDRHHRQAGRIYRVIQEIAPGSGPAKFSALTPNPLGAALQQEYPDMVAASARFWHYWGQGFNLVYREKRFHEVNFAFCDAEAFTIFDFEFIRGDPQTALSDPFSVVLTQTAAEKYFGRDDPLGRLLRVNDGYDLQVTGVIRDMPAQSHFHFDFLASYRTLSQQAWGQYLDQWREDFCYTYLLLAPNVPPERLQDQFAAIEAKFLPDPLPAQRAYQLQPLTDIHLNSRTEGDIEANSSPQPGLILLAIAGFILLVSILNYINLTTAGYAARIREAGIRKTLGARRWQLIGQLIAESVLLCSTALLLSMAASELLLPGFAALTGKAITIRLQDDVGILLLLGILGLLISLLSGWYPAAFLSRVRPAAGLQHLPLLDVKRGQGRRIFVIAQLVIATSLIIGVIAIHQQLSFVAHFPLNFARESILILPVNQTPVAGEHYEAFTSELRRHPRVISATGLRTVTGFEHIKEPFAIVANGTAEAPEIIPFQLVRNDFLKTFDIDLVAGRDFSADFPGDVFDAVLVNQAMARRLGGAERAVGRQLRHPGWGQLLVIGVIRDFNFESLHSDIKPLIIKLIWPRRQEALTDYLAIRIIPGDIPSTLDFISRKWRQFAPNDPFEYEFLDHKLEGFYREETTLGKLAAVFTVVAVLIACLGLLGLISYITERRTKEIAIRKVFGAPVGSIFRLLAREFLLLVLIATPPAWAIAYLAVKTWLVNFAYRIEPAPATFFLTTAIILVLVLAAISFHIIRAGRRNPVEFLRYE